MTILFELGVQSMDVMSLSCYLVVSVSDPRQNCQMVRTSDRTSVAFQLFPALENICTPFKFKLTAIPPCAGVSGPVSQPQQ